MRFPLPKVAAHYYCAMLGAYGVMVSMFFTLAMMFLSYQAQQRWMEITQIAVAIFCGFLAAMFIVSLAQVLPSAVLGLWRSRKTFRPRLPPTLARAQVLLDLIPWDIRVASPEKSVCAVYGHMLEEGQAPRCLLVGFAGCWHGLVFEQDGHILTSLGDRFLDPMDEMMYGMSPQREFRVDGVELDWADCEMAFTPDRNIRCWLDAEELEEGCPVVETVSPPRRI